MNAVRIRSKLPEVWRIVPSVPTLMASTWGRIRCVPFEGPMPNGGTRVYQGKPWRGCWTGPRYIVRHRGRTYKVSRLICETFHGPAPPARPCCLHRDEDARNNVPGNLEWGTQKENLNAPGFLSYCRSRTGDDNPYRKGRTRRV